MSSPDGVDPDILAICERLARVKHKILVLSGKGGVGKSTIAAQLAHGLSSRSFDVGFLDIDICGPSAPTIFGQRGQEIHRSNSGWSPVYVNENLSVMSIGFLLESADDAIIWRGPRKNGLIKQFLRDTEWGSLDYLVIDAPPGTSDEHLSIVQYLNYTGIDGALVVTTPEEMAMADVRKELNFCAKVGVRVLGVVENMSGLCVPLESDNLKFTSGPEGKDVSDEVRNILAKHFDRKTLTGSRTSVRSSRLQLSVLVDVFASSHGGGAKMCEVAGVPFLGTVPLDPAIALAADHGHSLFHNEEKSDHKRCSICSEGSQMNMRATKSLETLVDRVMQALVKVVTPSAVKISSQ